MSASWRLIELELHHDPRQQVLNATHLGWMMAVDGLGKLQKMTSNRIQRVFHIYSRSWELGMQTDFGHPECLGTSISFMLLSPSFSTFYRHCDLFLAHYPAWVSMATGSTSPWRLEMDNLGVVQNRIPQDSGGLCACMFLHQKNRGDTKNVKIIPARDPKQCGGAGG